MKAYRCSLQLAQHVLLLSSMFCLVGCASSPKTFPGPDGITYHEDKDLQKVWLAEGFRFTDFDALYVEPVGSEVTVDAQHTNRLERTRFALQDQISSSIGQRGIFKYVVTRQQDLPPNAKTLKLSMTIIEYSAGSTATRILIGLSAGAPSFAVRGRATASENGRPLWAFEASRRAESSRAYFGGIMGASATSDSLQDYDIKDLATDIADYLIRVSKPAAN